MVIGNKFFCVNDLKVTNSIGCGSPLVRFGAMRRGHSEAVVDAASIRESIMGVKKIFAWVSR